jgi:hypothetical protein
LHALSSFVLFLPSCVCVCMLNVVSHVYVCVSTMKDYSNHLEQLTIIISLANFLLPAHLVLGHPFT